MTAYHIRVTLIGEIFLGFLGFGDGFLIGGGSSALFGGIGSAGSERGGAGDGGGAEEVCTAGSHAEGRSEAGHPE